jgi:hypothetical protein
VGTDLYVVMAEFLKFEGRGPLGRPKEYRRIILK